VNFSSAVHPDFLKLIYF